MLEGNLIGFEHIGIPAHHIEQCRDWYKDVLDFDVLYENEVATEAGKSRFCFIRSIGEKVRRCERVLNMSQEIS